MYNIVKIIVYALNKTYMNLYMYQVYVPKLKIIWSEKMINTHKDFVSFQESHDLIITFEKNVIFKCYLCFTHLFIILISLLHRHSKAFLYIKKNIAP